MRETRANTSRQYLLDKPLEWTVGVFFVNTELSLELRTVIAGISGFDDYPFAYLLAARTPATIDMMFSRIVNNQNGTSMYTPHPMWSSPPDYPVVNAPNMLGTTNR